MSRGHVPRTGYFAGDLCLWNENLVLVNLGYPSPNLEIVGQGD